MAGWVYILSNPEMPELLKIGFTERDPLSRAKEISQDTGVPSEFIVDYQVYSSRPYELERKVHELLHEYRLNNNREFFRCTHASAIEAIKQAILILGLEDDPSTGLEIYHTINKKVIEKRLKVKALYSKIKSLVSQREQEKHLIELFEKRKEALIKLNSELKVEIGNLKLSFYEKKKEILESKLHIQRDELEELRKNISLLSTENLTIKKEIECFISDSIDSLSSLLNSLEEKISLIRQEITSLSKENISLNTKKEDLVMLNSWFIQDIKAKKEQSSNVYKEKAIKSAEKEYDGDVFAAFFMMAIIFIMGIWIGSFLIDVIIAFLKRLGNGNIDDINMLHKFAKIAGVFILLISSIFFFKEEKKQAENKKNIAIQKVDK